MRHIKRWTAKALVWLLGVSLFISPCSPAYAASAGEIDFGKTGAITLSLKTSDGTAVSDGAVTLYQVAALYLDNGDMAYSYTEAFAACGVEPDVEDTSLPTLLAAYAKSSSITGTSAAIGSDGTVTFADLELGLYLIVQTTASDNYKTIDPFVVTVPMQSGEEWVYIVDASPKVGTVASTDSGESDEPDESDESDESNEAAESDESNESDESDESDEVRIPQTGQLNWPIPVLAVSGLLLFALGWVLNRSGRTEREA